MLKKYDCTVILTHKSTNGNLSHNEFAASMHLIFQISFINATELAAIRSPDVASQCRARQTNGRRRRLGA